MSRYSFVEDKFTEGSKVKALVDFEYISEGAILTVSYVDEDIVFFEEYDDYGLHYSDIRMIKRNEEWD